MGSLHWGSLAIGLLLGWLLSRYLAGRRTATVGG